MTISLYDNHVCYCHIFCHSRCHTGLRRPRTVIPSCYRSRKCGFGRWNLYFFPFRLWKCEILVFKLRFTLVMPTSGLWPSYSFPVRIQSSNVQPRNPTRTPVRSMKTAAQNTYPFRRKLNRRRPPSLGTKVTKALIIIET